MGFGDGVDQAVIDHRMPPYLGNIRGLLEAAYTCQGILPQQLAIVCQQGHDLPRTEGADDGTAGGCRTGTADEAGDLRQTAVAPKLLAILGIDGSQDVLRGGGIDPAVVVSRPTAQGSAQGCLPADFTILGSKRIEPAIAGRHIDLAAAERYPAPEVFFTAAAITTQIAGPEPPAVRKVESADPTTGIKREYPSIARDRLGKQPAAVAAALAHARTPDLTK